MPIYEFHCAECERDSEILVRSTDWKGTPCPHCGSKRLAKKLSVFASNTADGGGEGSACEMGSSSCCRCSGRGPHSH